MGRQTIQAQKEMTQQHAYTLSQLARYVTDAIAASPALKGAWVVGETCDLRVVGGHCYLDLIEKDPSTGKALARMPARIWANVFHRLSDQFYSATGQALASDMKVMMYVAVSFHPAYGLSLTVYDINCNFTLGEAMRKRREILERLKREGMIDANRSLPWPTHAYRIAIVSAAGAAGYGDFINQLCHNSASLRFEAKLYPAAMQGERTAPSIIAALEQINAEIDRWDCVVLIRGGGATSDLAWFDDYHLAANIAGFPIPVIVGIGHERDVTVLDYVANMRVKTPTAAAQWLIARGEECLGRLQALGQAMLQTMTDRLGGCHQQLAFISGQLPSVAANAIARARHRLLMARNGIAGIADQRFGPEHTRLQGIAASLAQAAKVCVQREHQRIDNAQCLLDVLSPRATLRRGYTITLVDGHAATSSDLQAGQAIRTVFADGTAISTVTHIENEQPLDTIRQ